ALRARVADPRGTPICGASVELKLRNPDSITERAAARAQAIATTSEDGLAARDFTLEELAQGPMEPAPEGYTIQVPVVAPVPPGFTRVVLTAKRAGYGDVTGE